MDRLELPIISLNNKYRVMMTTQPKSHSSSMSGTDTGVPKGRYIGILVPPGDILQSPVNPLTRAGLEASQFSDVDDLLSWAVENERVILLVDVPLIQQDSEFGEKLRLARERATICVVGLVSDGDFDQRMNAAKLGVSVVMVRPVSDDRLVRIIDTFSERLTPVRRDLVYIPLTQDQGVLSSEYLAPMPHLKIHQVQPRDSIKSLAAFERTLVLVESEEDDPQARALIHAIGVNEEAINHPIVWIRPIRDGGEDLAFRFSIFPMLDISVKVYFDSLIPLMDGLYGLAGIDRAGKIEGFYGDFAFGENAYAKVNEIVRFGHAHQVPMAIACFNIGDYYRILSEHGFDVANRAIRDLDLMLSKAVSGMDFQLRVAMDKLMVLFMGKSAQEAADKIKPIISIMQQMKVTGEGRMLSSVSASVVAVTRDAETDIHEALLGLTQAEQSTNNLFIRP